MSDRADLHLHRLGEVLRTVRLRVNEVSPITDLLAGSIEGVVAFSGGFRAQVEVIRTETDTIYDVRWETDPG